jgi:FkbM family methyltransferase
MTSIRKYVLTYEDSAPAMFNWARYIWHVVIKKDTVYPNVTKAIFKLIRSADAIAIDVGANVGIVTRYFSRYFAVTHAIEPLPYLSKRLDSLQSARIKVHQCALGAEDGQITIRTPIGAGGKPFHALSTASSSNTLSMFEHEGVAECTVPQRKLSTLLTKDAGQVGYLKIDVEGFEHDVLLGANELISRDRPIIQLEISRTHNPNYLDILELMKSLKYSGFSMNQNHLKNNMIECIQDQPFSFGLNSKAFVDYQYEFLFIPDEKTGIFKSLITQ